MLNYNKLPINLITLGSVVSGVRSSTVQSLRGCISVWVRACVWLWLYVHSLETRPRKYGSSKSFRCWSGLEHTHRAPAHCVRGKQRCVLGARKASDLVPESGMPPNAGAKHISFITFSHKSHSFKDFTV